MALHGLPTPLAISVQQVRILLFIGQCEALNTFISDADLNLEYKKEFYGERLQRFSHVEFISH